MVSRGVVRHWARPVLFGWFVVIDVLLVFDAWVHRAGIGGNVQTYNAAARAWLAGGDPWGQAYATSFGAQWLVAPPPALAPFLLTAGAPDPVAIAAWVGAAALAGVLVVRRLHLPWLWLAFPPLFGSAFWGSADNVVLALMVCGAPWLAAFVRVTFAPALVAERAWGQLALFVAASGVSVLLMPWDAFARDLPAIAAHARDQAPFGGTSAFAFPILVPVVALALVRLGWRRGWYLAVPALWPAAQGNYGLVATPVLASMPTVAAAMSVPMPAVGAIGIVLQAAREAMRLTFGRVVPGGPRTGGADVASAARSR